MRLAIFSNRSHADGQFMENNAIASDRIQFQNMSAVLYIAMYNMCEVMRCRSSFVTNSNALCTALGIFMRIERAFSKYISATASPLRFANVCEKIKH